MKENLFLCVYLCFIFLLLLVINMLTPNFTRKEIVFGVRIPEDKIHSAEIKDIKRQFIKNNLIIGIPFILLFSFLNYKFLSAAVILFTVFAFVFIDFLVYMISNRAVKALKLKNSWFQGKKQAVAVDIGYSRDKEKTMVSPWLFLIPISIILINIILGYANYAPLPDRVPTHWDLSGNINGYQAKSPFLIWEMPLVEMTVTVMLFITYKIIGWSKQQTNVSNPEISVKKNRKFRKIWSIYTVLLTVAVNLILTAGTIQIFDVVEIPHLFVMIFTIVFVILITFISLVLFIKIGQGGSNIKIGEQGSGKAESEFTDKDDDNFWKLANIIYYNPQDPSLFVEKRFGVGWTVNAGRPAGKAIYIGLIVFIIAVIGFSIFAKN